MSTDEQVYVDHDLWKRARSRSTQASRSNSRQPKRLLLRDASTMTARPTEFLDDAYRHPIGMTTLLVGDGGLGKSLYAVGLAKQVTDAGCGAIFATAEDDPEKTWLPRLMAAGVALKRVKLVRIEREQDGFDWEESMQLPDDLLLLEQAVSDFAETAELRVQLLVIDPLEAHLSDVNDDGNSSTRRRQALAPLEAFANREEIHALALHHINKDTSQRASHRVLGTIANRNAPRSMLLFGLNPDNKDERVLFHDKHNVSPKSPTQVYAVEPTTVKNDSGETIPTAKLVYRRDDDLDVESIFGRTSSSEADELSEAKTFLAAELADCEQPVTAVNKNADGLGISRRTLERARKELGVEAVRTGGIGRLGTWMLRLPFREETDEKFWVA